MENERIGQAGEYKTPRRRKIYGCLAITSALIALGGAGDVMYNVFTVNSKLDSIPKPSQVKSLELGRTTIEQLEERKNNLRKKLDVPYKNDTTEKLKEFYGGDKEISLINDSIKSVKEDLSEIGKDEEVRGYWDRIRETNNNWFKRVGLGFGVLLLGGLGTDTFMRKYFKYRK